MNFPLFDETSKSIKTPFFKIEPKTIKNNIPKKIHQLWIGNKKPPLDWMHTWKIKNPDYEYIFWNEEELEWVAI